MKLYHVDIQKSEIDLILKGLLEIQDRPDIKNQTELKNLIEQFLDPDSHYDVTVIPE